VEGRFVKVTQGEQATSRRPFGLTDRYITALERYVFEPRELDLADAHALGREALDEGLGVIAMTVMQCQAISAILVRPLTDRQRDRALEAAETFMVESMSSFEMAHRGYAEANRALQRLNEVLEGQAKRIASALHDEAAQLLASVHFALAELSLNLPSERRPDVDAVRGLLSQIEDRLRSLAHELRPPVLTNLGLTAALRFLTTAAAKRWGLAVTIEGSIDRKLPTAVETAIYRVAQEAITNVAKHASATTAHIRLWIAADRLGCSISDDGVGFAASDKAAEGLGLIEIRERIAALGGTVRFGSRIPHGAEVTLELPLERVETT
jgi:signal transduction histidine kinase